MAVSEIGNIISCLTKQIHVGNSHGHAKGLIVKTHLKAQKGRRSVSEKSFNVASPVKCPCFITL